MLDQVHVELSKHQQRGPSEALADDHNNALYGQVVVQGDIAPRDIPLPISQIQVKDDDVGDVEEEFLESEVLCLAV